MVTLQARAGEYDDAAQLLFQALEREPLPPELEGKMMHAERAVQEPACATLRACAVESCCLHSSDRRRSGSKEALEHTASGSAGCSR